MRNLKKVMIIIIMLNMFLIPVNSYSAFYDMEYPPNSSGRADYTEEDAKVEEEKPKEDTSSEDFVGKSSNNYLKSLKVQNAKIEPEFNRQYVDYTVTLNDETIRKIKIVAEAEDVNAKIEGVGEIQLQDGTNNLRVVVTAENGSVQFYNLTVEVPVIQATSTDETIENELIQTEAENNQDMSKYFIILVVVAIIIITIYLIFKRKK